MAKISTLIISLKITALRVTNQSPKGLNWISQSYGGINYLSYIYDRDLSLRKTFPILTVWEKQHILHDAYIDLFIHNTQNQRNLVICYSYYIC